jgi:hypothetical protein
MMVAVVVVTNIEPIDRTFAERLATIMAMVARCECQDQRARGAGSHRRFGLWVTRIRGGAPSPCTRNKAGLDVVRTKATRVEEGVMPRVLTVGRLPGCSGCAP